MGARWRYLAVVLLAASGCDAAFGLERDPPPGLEGYDHCGAFLYSDPLRYAAVMSPAVGPWSWDDARAACKLRGMDLAVLNDMHELASSQNEVWPYWVGEQSSGAALAAIDGCPAVDAPVATRLVAADTVACGIVAGPLEVDGASCDGVLPDGFVSSAMCETPRPEDLGCVGNDPAITRYVMSDAPLPYKEATKLCAGEGGHLVVAETAAEWAVIAQQAQPFWIGSRMQSGTWQAVTGCPATYAWANNTPGDVEDGSCLATQMSEREDAGGPVTEGVAATACDESRFALCEID